MRRVGALAAMAVAGLLLAGCTTAGGPQPVSASLGTAPTSFAEAGPATPANGDVMGKLDPSAQRAARAAEQKALEFGRAGTPVKWKNGKSSGEIVPATPYQVNAYSCRDYVHTITVSGETQSARGTACRQPNGTWQPVS